MRSKPGCAFQADAVLYALGLLDRAETERIGAHVSSGCAVCDREIRQATHTTAELVLTGPLATPPPSLRDRLMSRIAAEGSASTKPGAYEVRATPPLPDAVVRSDQGSWKPLSPGVTRKTLFYDRAANTATFLLRFEPGARLQAHRHGGLEQCLVLEGEVRDGDMVLKAGDFQALEADSIHPTAVSDTGCLLLIVAAAPDQTKFV